MVYIYNKAGQKEYRNYIVLGNEFYSFKSYFISIGAVAEISASGIKNWYIKWPKGKTDTIFADYYYNENGPNNCNCSHPLKELKLNEKSLLYKTNDDINGVFVFDW